MFPFVPTILQKAAYTQYKDEPEQRATSNVLWGNEKNTFIVAQWRRETVLYEVTDLKEPRENSKNDIWCFKEFHLNLKQHKLFPFSCLP